MRFVLAVVIGVWLGLVLGAAAAERPNFLWISSEDNGPHLGAYGDGYATTPHLDALARKGCVYRNVWSNAPVCAPARTTLIMGMYATTLGAQHMRSAVAMPEGLKMFPQFMRQAGYYCTNNAKEDYNVAKPEGVWDASSRNAHWRNRPDGAPFFAVFNSGVTHEGQIRRRPHTFVHDPEEAPVPAYHPDVPAVREAWAQYYDALTEMDAWAGGLLEELAAAGLAEDTIVFYWGDHGPGLPRCKRFPYHSGLHVPLIVYIPEKFRGLASEDYVAGGESERLVGFVDFAPTMLSLAGIAPPAFMQGRAFLGAHEREPSEYLFGFRGRMDERYDMMRVVRDERFVYLRNYMPHRPYGQYVSYMFETPMTVEWKRLYDAGALEPPATLFWELKPPEELYDLQNDPDEVRNLAGDPAFAEKLDALRSALAAHLKSTRDLGFLPEPDMHARAADSTPYALGQNPERYPFERIRAAAELAAGYDRGDAAELAGLLRDNDAAVRYWAATGLLARGEEAVGAHVDSLRTALSDESASVRIVAAEALGRYGGADDRKRALDSLLPSCSLDGNDVYAAVMALNALDYLDDVATPRVDAIRALPDQQNGLNGKFRNYVPRLLDEISADIDG